VGPVDPCNVDRGRDLVSLRLRLPPFGDRDERQFLLLADRPVVGHSETQQHRGPPQQRYDEEGAERDGPIVCRSKPCQESFLRNKGSNGTTEYRSRTCAKKLCAPAQSVWSISLMSLPPSSFSISAAPVSELSSRSLSAVSSGLVSSASPAGDASTGEAGGAGAGSAAEGGSGSGSGTGAGSCVEAGVDGGTAAGASQPVSAAARASRGSPGGWAVEGWTG